MLRSQKLQELESWYLGSVSFLRSTKHEDGEKDSKTFCNKTEASGAD